MMNIIALQIRTRPKQHYNDKIYTEKSRQNKHG